MDMKRAWAGKERAVSRGDLNINQRSQPEDTRFVKTETKSVTQPTTTAIGKQGDRGTYSCI